MKVEISASVYSVITARTGERQRVEAYLYDHSKIVSEHDAGKYLFLILKTTAWTTLETESHDATSVHQAPADIYGRGAGELIREAFYLANYQIDRLSSGLIGGILAGSQPEAESLLADAAVNV